MENELIDVEDEVYIKEINSIKVIHYKENYNNQNFLKDNRFKNWLNEEIMKKGINGRYNILNKCSKCDFFLYGKYNEVKSCPHCNSFLFDHICAFCGKQYRSYSFCCSKRGLIDDFYFFFFDAFYTDFLDCGKYIPLIFNLIFIGIIFFSLFLHQKLKEGDKEFLTFSNKRTKLSNFAKIIALLFALVLSFIYFFVFIIIYFIFLILYFTEKPKNK